MSINPDWLVEMQRHNGLQEIKGARHSPTIQAWLKELGAWWTDDETAWCGVAVAHCLKVGKRAIPQYWYRAMAYAQNYGTVLQKPCVGAIAVYSRKGGGHVAIVAGKDKQGRIMCYGGNQNNAVNVMAFDPARPVVYVWPPKSDGSKTIPFAERYNLPLLKSDGKVSLDEA